jgi:hypothetical protein
MMIEEREWVLIDNTMVKTLSIKTSRELRFLRTNQKRGRSLVDRTLEVPYALSSQINS